MNLPKNIAVLGAGSWGTALVKILSDHGLKSGLPGSLSWWVRKEQSARFIRENGHNPDYLSSVEIHTAKINITHHIQEVVKNADLCVMAIPSAFLKDSLDGLNAADFKGKFAVSAIKGLLPHSRKIVADFFMEEYGMPHENLLVISGPCHAEEVAAEKLSYLTIAGLNEEVCRFFASLLSNRYIRTICSRDITGTEYGAVLKNIYAVGSGICHGLGYGDNFQAVLVSNAIREMEAFLYQVHAHPREINHSAYLGDLLVTAYSRHSRNRTFGTMIGKGYSVKSAQLEMKMIAEGYYATKSIHELNSKLGAPMPIADTVYRIIYEGKSAADEIRELSEHLV